MNIPATSKRGGSYLVVLVTTAAMLVGCTMDGPGAERLRVRGTEGDPASEEPNADPAPGAKPKKKDAGAGTTTGGAGGTAGTPGSAGTPGAGSPGSAGSPGMGSPGGGSPGTDAGAGVDAGPIDPNALRFARDVKPLLVQQCGECHHAGTKIDLGVPLTAAMTDKVLSTAAPGGTMPPAPRDRMPAAALEVVRRWKAGGLVP